MTNTKKKVSSDRQKGCWTRTRLVQAATSADTLLSARRA